LLPRNTPPKAEGASSQGQEKQHASPRPPQALFQGGQPGVHEQWEDSSPHPPPPPPVGGPAQDAQEATLPASLGGESAPVREQASSSTWEAYPGSGYTDGAADPYLDMFQAAPQPRKPWSGADSTNHHQHQHHQHASGSTQAHNHVEHDPNFGSTGVEQGRGAVTSDGQDEENKLLEGRLKRYSGEYGFIVCSSCPGDIFAPLAGFQNMVPLPCQAGPNGSPGGPRVSFRLTYRDGKPRAVEIRILEQQVPQEESLHQQQAPPVLSGDQDQVQPGQAGFQPNLAEARRLVSQLLPHLPDNAPPEVRQYLLSL